jgi:hypothetical protein
LDDIKALHENALSITTLVLEDVVFMPVENFDCRLPEPPLIKVLSIEFCKGPFISLEPWVLYFLRTYVHLRDFTFGYYAQVNEDLPENPAQTIIMALGDNIQSFRTNLEIQRYHELEEFNRKNIHLNDFEFSLDRSGDFQFKGDELVRRCYMFQHLQILVIFWFNPEIFEITK